MLLMGSEDWHDLVPPKFIGLLGMETLDPKLVVEPWLRPGAVYTEGVKDRRFHDVRQWIAMLRLICQYQPGQTIAEQVNEEGVSTEVQPTEVITTPAEECQGRYFLRSERKLEEKKEDPLTLDNDTVPDDNTSPPIKKARYDLRSRSNKPDLKDTLNLADKTPTAPESRTMVIRVAGTGRALKVDQCNNIVSRMQYSGRRGT
jgi:hypothetical protein